MPNQYASVRRQWKPIETERDLKALWRGERFEQKDAVEEALRVYEMAIRVEGWQAVKGWARPLIEDNAILNAQLVELAMCAIEQKDKAFFTEITEHLLAHSPPNYFRFWLTLFTTRHSHFGEKLFRQQLAKLSDYRLVKYRRWLRKIMRKLRFRCHTAREKAVGAIAFGMYRDYKAKEYPSEVFQAYIACCDAARTPQKTKQGKPVSRTRQMVAFTRAAEKLGIWSITEGIRTSYRLPRTLGYLAAMAPKMTNAELLRALRAFDANLHTASHKKAPEDVVRLADYLRQRLEKMEVSLEEWCKIYPYLASPALLRVLESLIDGHLERYLSEMAPTVTWNPVLVVPHALDGRSFRVALLASYLLYQTSHEASLFLLTEELVQALSHPTLLWPYGYGVQPPARHWEPRPKQKHRPLYELVQGSFPLAAQRRQSLPLQYDACLNSLRYHLYRTLLCRGSSSSRDVPLLFLPDEPPKEVRPALETLLEMFPAAVLLLFDRPWEKPLELPHLLHLEIPASVEQALGPILSLGESLPAWQKTFASHKEKTDEELRHLLLGTPPYVQHLPQGPYSD